MWKRLGRRGRVGAVAVMAALVVALLVWLAPRHSAHENLRTIRVMAAASLTDVVTELATTFESAHTGMHVELSFGSSSTLARQIGEGAPADVFLSANTDWMDYLDARRLVDRPTRRDVLGNALVVIAPAAARSVPTQVADLAGDAVGRVGLGDPSGVPAGIYARQALEHLGLWSAVEPKAVLGADVRVIVAYVERDEVDVGIVYRTDARVSDAVRELFPLPEAAQPDIRYSFARLTQAADPEAALALLDFLTGPEGRQAFERAGFLWRAEGSR